MSTKPLPEKKIDNFLISIIEVVFLFTERRAFLS